MNVFLMNKDHDFDPDAALPLNAGDLIQDLELNTLFSAMGDKDDFLFKVAKTAVLTGLCEPDAIIYRQHMLADCIEQAPTIKKIYDIAVETLEGERKIWGWRKHPQGLLHHSLELLHLFVPMLKKLKQIADEHSSSFHAEGFVQFFAMLTSRLDDNYISLVEDHLHKLAFIDGLLVSASIGGGGKGTSYILHKQPPRDTWMERLFKWFMDIINKRPRYVYEVSPFDVAGHSAVSDLRDEGIKDVAITVAQAADDIRNFFTSLRVELGFYVGCLNLHHKLLAKNNPVCFAEPLPAGGAIYACQAMYDPCLSLSMGAAVVGNEMGDSPKMLVMITGANRGGKSTFLRSVGLAQMMMQCGMFVAAKSFRASVHSGIFTHFKREEDVEMKSGKLDEELARMSGIIDQIKPNSLMLFNESFASTNEREGSEIARQIVHALLESRIKIFYVTHMFDLSQSLYLENMHDILFLRAERLSNGDRTFRLIEGEPLQTSFGEDLYSTIFGAELKHKRRQ